MNKLCNGLSLSHLRSDAEIFEESLVGAPELTPHGLLHLLVGVDQFGGLFEPVQEDLRARLNMG